VISGEVGWRVLRVVPADPHPVELTEDTTPSGDRVGARTASETARCPPRVVGRSPSFSRNGGESFAGTVIGEGPSLPAGPHHNNFERGGQRETRGLSELAGQLARGWRELAANSPSASISVNGCPALLPSHTPLLNTQALPTMVTSGRDLTDLMNGSVGLLEFPGFRPDSPDVDRTDAGFICASIRPPSSRSSGSGAPTTSTVHVRWHRAGLAAISRGPGPVDVGFGDAADIGDQGRLERGVARR